MNRSNHFQYKKLFHHLLEKRDLLKLKPYTDAEATVLGYKEGKGKFSKMVGSLKVQDFRDRWNSFFIGSGLSDAQRKNHHQYKVTFRIKVLLEP